MKHPDGPVYYNEFDLGAAAWLRNLIAAGLIAPGVVDTRSILDVTPAELRPFTQCHFFAGIGVWSFALRAAGWRDDRPVWTGSCPCQPFSAAGDGLAFADERHLWPAFFHLIDQHVKWCRKEKRQVPDIFGEQVASKDVDTWIDLVQADLEGVGYTVGAVAFPSAGVGAPHIRDRNYWVAHAHSRQQPRLTVVRGIERDGEDAGWPEGIGQPEPCGDVRGLADARLPQCKSQSNVGAAGVFGAAIQPGKQWDVSSDMGATLSATPASGPTDSYWRDADWLFCRDGKWRPVEPGTFPLAHGTAGRVGRSGTDWHTPAGKEGKGHRASRLRGYGNAINAIQATEFIRAIIN